MANENTCVESSDHEWQEEYYGNRCKKCDLFFPHGGAPWDPYCPECGAMFPEECTCEDFSNYDLE